MAHGRTLFVSDLHLHAGLPEAITQFEHFLQQDAARSDGLYILGDLFESWIGDDDDDAARQRVCDALRMLTRQGTPCHVQHGNRDFLLGAGFAARTGCEIVADPLVFTKGSLRFVVSHGDALCTRDVGYQRLRRIVRSATVQRAWRWLPLALRRALAARARDRSAQHTRRKSADIMDVTPEAVTALLRDTRADVLIHGHTHRPGEHPLTVDGRACLRIVLGDWYEQGSVLELRGDGTHALSRLARSQATSGLARKRVGPESP